jgi:hypothetical protein
MRILLTVLAVSALVTSISVLGREAVSHKAEGRSGNQATQPGGKARQSYACATQGAAEPGAAAASQQPKAKNQAIREFCLELDPPQTVVEECLRPVLGETGWTLPTSSLKDTPLFQATRSLSAEELHRAAQTEIGGGKIQWEEGGANVEIRLIPRSGGGTQVRLRARILGKGSTSLRLMRMSPWWPLASTGALECDILAALETRCKVRP